jgi:hypothetical protein
MGVWKSLVERMKDKREELQRKAVKKAARAALDGAGKTVDLAGRAVERVLFGNLDDDEDGKAKKKPEPPADPFAKLKAAEAAQKEREREEKQRAKDERARKARVDAEVDADLAALKKKLGK